MAIHWWKKYVIRRSPFSNHYHPLVPISPSLQLLSSRPSSLLSITLAICPICHLATITNIACSLTLPSTNPYHLQQSIYFTCLPPIVNHCSSNSLISTASSIPSILPIAAATANADNDDLFTKVWLSESKWDLRLQDQGCAKDALPINTHRRLHNPPIGPHLYYSIVKIALTLYNVSSNFDLEFCFFFVSRIVDMMGYF